MQPLTAAVGALKQVFFHGHGFPGKSAGMDSLPTLRQIGEHIVMTAAHNLRFIERVHLEPAAAY